MITTDSLPQPMLGKIVCSICLEGLSVEEINRILAALKSYSHKLCYQNEYSEIGEKVAVPYIYLATYENFDQANQLVTALVSLGIDAETITIVGKGHPSFGESPLKGECVFDQ